MQTLSNIKDLNTQNTLAAEQREQAVMSNLARLLASENIHVAFRKAPTASFNVKTRVLIIPIFTSTLSKELVQMLVAHEVGHALWTPAEGWHGTVSSRGMVYKGYLNVCEDARIERKIKIKYPGVNRDFFFGYRELLDKGFFGDLRSVLRNPRGVSLADRINLYYKVGPHVPNILFTQDELDLVEQVGETDTFNDVLRVTDLVWEYDKQFRKDRREQAKSAPDAGGEYHQPEANDDNDDDGIDSLDRDDRNDAPKSDDNEDDLSDMDDEGDNQDLTPVDDEETGDDGEGDASIGDDDGEGSDDDDGEGSDDDDDEETRFGDGAGGDAAADRDDAPEFAETDRIFRQKESELLDPACRDIIYATLNNPLTEKDVKIPYKNMLRACEDSFSNSINYELNQYRGFDEARRTAWIAEEERKFHAEFRKRHERYITHLAREFELKRNAWTTSRSREARGGTLNLNKMHQYKFNDDLFKKVSVVPKGKNHGMIMIVDASGSMANSIENVLEQAAVLSMFCRRVQIPFRVYAFTNPGFTEIERMYGFKQPRIKPRVNKYDRSLVDAMGDGCEIQQEQYALMELFSDRMTLRDFNKALFYYISAVSNRYGGRKIAMSSTPLNDAILTIPSMVKNLREETKVDKVSVVVLTDGSSDCSNFSGRGLDSARHRVILTSPWNRKAFEVMAVDQSAVDYRTRPHYDDLCFTKTYIKMAADAANATIVGYHVVPGRMAAGMLNEYRGFYKKSADDMKMDFRNNKMMAIDDFGYAQYFIMWDKALNQEDKTLAAVDSEMTVRRATSVFNAMQQSRQVNRVFLSKFMDLIA